MLFRKPHKSLVPVIIELKRPNALGYNKDRYDFKRQVDAYRKSAAKFYSDQTGAPITADQIPCIFIWKNNLKLDYQDPETRKVLDQRNITIKNFE